MLFFCQIVGGLFFLDALFGLLFFSTVVFIFLFLLLFVCFFSCFFLRFSKSAAPQFFMVVFHISFRLFFCGEGIFMATFFAVFFFILSGDLTISTVSTLYGTLWAQLNVLYM